MAKHRAGEKGRWCAGPPPRRVGGGGQVEQVGPFRFVELQGPGEAVTVTLEEA